MAHEKMEKYLQRIKKRYPEHFWRVRVLDCGSLDINGSNKDLWNLECGYTGLDLAPGKNVNIVMPMENADWIDEHFHVVMSTECFEHNPEWKIGLLNMIRMLRPGGLIIVTCAKDPRQEHGTCRFAAEASPFTSDSDYYQNLTEEDIRSVIDVDEFNFVEFESNNDPGDLYFHAIKKGKLDHGCTCDNAIFNREQKTWLQT